VSVRPSIVTVADEKPFDIIKARFLKAVSLLNSSSDTSSLKLATSSEPRTVLAALISTDAATTNLVLSSKYEIPIEPLSLPLVFKVDVTVALTSPPLSLIYVPLVTMLAAGALCSVKLTVAMVDGSLRLDSRPSATRFALCLASAPSRNLPAGVEVSVNCAVEAGSTMCTSILKPLSV